MSASFEEKSVWIQLISVVVIMGAYLVFAAGMLAQGVTTLVAFVPLFIVAVVLLVIVLVAGYIVVAIASRPAGRDERDRLIEWRAESNSSWMLGAGVIVGITGMVLGLENVWVAHWLFLSLVLSEILRFVMQLVYYRRGF